MDNGSMENMENKGLPELIQVKSPVSFVKLTGNGGFCNNCLKKSSMTVLPTESTEENYRAESLVYDIPQSDDISAEALATIIDLLNQLKAATSDQNVFVQNNTVVRDQIIRQLKSEILKSHNSLTNNQIKNLEVVSSNNFDEKTLTDILRSLLESSKKKSDDEGSLVYRAKKAPESVKSNSERISEDYLKILKNVHHYSKIVEDVFSHVSSKKTIHKVAEKAEQEKAEIKKSSAKPETNAKKIRNISNEITEVLSPNVMAEIQETFEKKIIKKLGLISPIVELQSKISELNVISNVNKLVTAVVKRSVPRVLKANTKLINKIVDRSEIEEIKQNILSHEEQYQVDKAVHKRNLDRIYNDIRKVYSTKNISQNISEVLKSSKFKNVNFEEAIKKNLLKVTSRNDVVNRLKNIYEKQVQKHNVRRVVDKNELVNKENVDVLDTEERLAIEDIVNLRRSNRNLETNIIDKTNLTERILNEEKIRKNLISVATKNEIANTVKNVYEKQIQKSNLNRIVDKSELVNKENTEVLDTEERSAIKDVVNLKRKSKIAETRYSEKTNIVERIFRDINSRNINYKTLINSLETIPNKTLAQNEILKRIFVSHFVDGKDRVLFKDTKKIDKFIEKHKDLILSDQVYGRIENAYEFKPIHLREKVIGNQEIEEVVEKNLKKILTPTTLTDKITKITTKDIYRNIVTPKITQHIKTVQERQNEYLIHSRKDGFAEQIYDHMDTPYMVYKEEPVLVAETKKEDQGSQDKQTSKKVTYKSPYIKEVVQPESIDTRKLEKDIIKKTLSKQEVENMINAHLREVNVDSISRAVMGRVEAKMRIDKRRSGIF